MEDDRETIIDIKERLVRIETMLEQQLKTDTLERQVIEEKIKVANNRIGDLESNQKWLVVTVVGAIIVAILKTIIK